MISMRRSAKQDKANRMTNYMEELANNVLENLLSNRKENRFSSDAIQDIKALALNRLWPMYTTPTTRKDFLKKVVEEDQIEKDIDRKLRAAMDIVRSNPRH